MAEEGSLVASWPFKQEEGNFSMVGFAQKYADQQAAASADRAVKLEQLATAAAQQGEAAQLLLDKAQAQLFSLENEVCVTGDITFNALYVIHHVFVGLEKAAGLGSLCPSLGF